MKNHALIVIIFLFTILNLSCAHSGKTSEVVKNNPTKKAGYVDVNGLHMYYEIHGEGAPLVLIHGGGSSIDVTYGKGIPLLAQTRQVIAFDEQAHGRTADINREFSFEQTADDIAAALKVLKIGKADVMGFSNGGTTALHLAIRHPEMVRKMIVASALYRKDGAPKEFWNYMKDAHITTMPQELKDAFVKIAPHPDQVQAMHDRDARRMIGFKNIPNSAIRKISAPTLVMGGYTDVPTPEHLLSLARLLPKGELVIWRGGHDTYLGDIVTVSPETRMLEASVIVISDFLNSESAKVPAK